MTTFLLTGFESDGRKDFCNPQTDLIRERIDSVVAEMLFKQQCGRLMEFIDFYIDKILFNVPSQKGKDTIFSKQFH
jgi:hypothetical protein